MVKQWVCHTRRCVASVSFYGNNPPHGQLQEILVAEGERFGLSGGFEPPTVFRTAAINRSASPPVGCAGRDLNPRPLAYGASELPDCSTAQFFVCLLSKNGYIIAYVIRKVKGKKYVLPFVVGRALRCGGMNRDSSRSQRSQLGFAVALASEDASVGSMVAVIFECR